MIDTIVFPAEQGDLSNVPEDDLRKDYYDARLNRAAFVRLLIVAGNQAEQERRQSIVDAEENIMCLIVAEFKRRGIDFPGEEK